MGRPIGASVILGLTVAACQAPQPSWITLRDPGGAFTAQFPQTAIIHDRTLKHFDVEQREYFLNQPGGGAMVITVADFTLAAWPEPDIIAGFVDVAEVDSAQILSDTPIQLQGHAGREIVLTDKSGRRVDYKVFFVGYRLYQVVAVTAKSAKPEESAAAARFQASFRFIL